MRRQPILLAVAATILAASAGAAFAFSERVKVACRDDYFQHCSMHPVGSVALRKCMRAVGPRLSRPCIDALKASGEVGKKDVERVARREAKKKRWQ